MELQPKLLRSKISELEKTLAGLKQNLKNAEEDCQHNFSEAKYDSYSTPDYTNCSLVPNGLRHTNTMKWSDRWKRECLLCGKVEYTEEFTTKTEKIPVFDKIKKEPSVTITN